jgi:hypothetical protein
MKWVLIIIVIANGYPAVTTQEFEDGPRCIDAMRDIYDLSRKNAGTYNVSLNCVPKGE